VRARSVSTWSCFRRGSWPKDTVGKVPGATFGWLTTSAGGLPEGIGAKDIDETLVDRYMAFRVRYRHPFLSDRPALNRFLAVLREMDLIAPQRPCEPSAQEKIVAEFRHHLREQGGFAPGDPPHLGEPQLLQVAQGCLHHISDFDY
jgi:hypothetical protein